VTVVTPHRYWMTTFASCARGVLDPSEITSTAYVCDGTGGNRPVAGFRLLTKVTGAGGPIAEIVAASADGTLVAYTSSVAHSVGFVDISNPASPVVLGAVDVSAAVGHGNGEPTSVALTPDGSFALVTVKDPTAPVANADPGALVFIDTATLTVTGSVVLGVGPEYGFLLLERSAAVAVLASAPTTSVPAPGRSITTASTTTPALTC
jgi:hypothetical protein